MNDTVPSQCLTICIKISWTLLYELRYEPLHMELVGKSILENPMKQSTSCGRQDQNQGDNFSTQLYSGKLLQSNMDYNHRTACSSVITIIPAKIHQFVQHF